MHLITGRSRSIQHSAKHSLRPRRVYVSRRCYMPLGCIALVLLLQIVLPPLSFAGEDKKGIINCDIQKGACTQSLGSRSVTLEILPRPVEAMQDLTFIVSVDGEAVARTPSIRLNMPAMEMGKNLVTLTPTGSGGYAGKGVIVRCRSGRRTWKATVDFPEIGKVDFIFDVIY